MRILHMIPDIGISNGVMSVILNYAKAMPDNIVFDVVYFSEKEKTKQAEIEALGGRVFKISPPSPKSIIKGEINSLFKHHQGEWQALHIHAPHFTVFIAPYAKKYGIKKICCHCHSTWYSLDSHNEKRNKLLAYPAGKLTDKQFACGRDAGLFWYKNEDSFEVLNNAVDCSKYRFDPQIRNTKRISMELNDKFVVGHTGRVYPPQKNHPFLIKIFAQIKKIKPNAVLLLAGAQKDNNLLSLVKEAGIEDSVIFLGLRTDIDELLQVMDVFVFPSFKEGLPVSVIEAQAAGLPVLMSDSITNEVAVTDLVISMSLNDSAEKWAEKAVEISNGKREDTFEILKQSGWDIFDCAKRLADYYSE